MTLKRLSLLFGLALLAPAATSWGQKASSWRVYKMADGLPEPSCGALTIGPNGRVLVRHVTRSSVSELDGYTLTVIAPPVPGTGRVYESPAGQLWTVGPQGLLEFKTGAWLVHPVREITAEFRASPPQSTHPVPLCPVRQGQVIFLLSDRLMEFNAEDPDRPRADVIRTVAQTRLARFSGMTVARDGGLWITGARGLAKVPGPARDLKSESEWREYVPPGSLEVMNLREAQEDDEGGVTMVAESTSNGQTTVVHFDGQRWAVVWIGSERIRYAWHGPGKTWWAATADSLVQIEEGRSELLGNEEISARQYLDVAVEPGGTFWLATSDGLFRYAPPAWRSPDPLQKITTLVQCVAEDSEGRLWFVAGGGLHLLLNEVHQEFPFPTTTERSLQATRALFPLRNGTLLLDLGNQLLQFQPDRRTFSAVSPAPTRGQLRPLGRLKDGSVCVQSSNASGSEPDYRLEVYDGTRFQPFPYPTPDRTFAGALTTLFAVQNGDLWLSGEQGVAWYHEKKWRTFSSADKTFPAGAFSFVELPDGKIWCATQDRIWEFDGRNWSAVRSGFDRINALLRTRDGSVWVASSSGLYRFFQGSWVENGTEEGLSSEDVREMHEDQRGRIWAATVRGLNRYYPEADPDAPQTRIQKLPDRESEIPEASVITLTFSGQDKWKSTPRNRLLYSHRLDEGDWSGFQEANTVSFADLSAGKHSFQVRAMDRNCNVDPKPVRVEFAVTVPWYRETRPLVIALVGLAVAIFFAALAFNRHRQLVRSYAAVELKVAERTRELEAAHRELLQNQKMKALGTLAAGIAHDFNNILSIIHGSAQIIEDNLENPDKVRTRLDRIKTVVAQGAGIATAMLGFSRGSDGQPSLCDLNAVVDDTIKLLGDRFLREVEVRFERAPNLPEVPASKDFIQQILLNFIFNAADAMNQHGRVILSTRPMDRLPAGMALVPAHTAAYVSVSVQDFGCGIPPENMLRIFEPFFTTKALSVRRGTGLGLSMAYELAKKMDAGLAVESFVGQGSTFTLILPVRELPAEAESPRPEFPAAPKPKPSVKP